MKISYNWLKWYLPDLSDKVIQAGIPEVPDAEKLVDIFNYHLCEVEGVEKTEDDNIFDINILPNRAHDLLSHQGVARELASLLNIKFVDPASKYKIPESVPTNLKIELQSGISRRYMGRIVRGVKIGPSPQWVVKHLESIGQRSINNMVDAANLVMYDCGQPTHVFDLNKVKEKLVIRQAIDGEKLITLDNKDCKLTVADCVIADAEKALAIAGIKGGKVAEVDSSTTDVILEVANFSPASVRKTAQSLNIFTDARKRFENDLSPELAPFAMTELSALVLEMCPGAVFEEVIDIYPVKQEVRTLSFSAERISSILGLEVSPEEIEDILKRYNFEYNLSPNPSPVRRGAGGEVFTITIPPMRLDLGIEEDMAEEIGRVLGYDKVKPVIPKINFMPKQNETYAKILWARSKLLSEGYSEVMTTTFKDIGEISVLASASDKNFLRTNLEEGLRESLKLNQANAPLLGMDEIKIFEIGTIFNIKNEEMHVAYGDKKGIKEMTLEEFASQMPKDFNSPLEEYPKGEVDAFVHPGASATPQEGNHFKMWSLLPFIARDVAVWVPENVKSEDVEKIIRENMGDKVIRGPELFDAFKKEGKVSYAFRLVFQSYEKTLTDMEINEIMTTITNKIKLQEGWQVR